MERDVLINELMWEYDYTRAKAQEIVSLYEAQGKYEDLCELIKTRQEISMEIRDDV